MYKQGYICLVHIHIHIQLIHVHYQNHMQGHEYYKRDFTGCCSLFSVVFKADYSLPALYAMMEAYHLFAIGASWGGYESLVLPTTGTIVRSVEKPPLLEGPTARYHIGLEDVADLIADIERGLEVLRTFDAKPKERDES